MYVPKGGDSSLKWKPKQSQHEAKPTEEPSKSEPAQAHSDQSSPAKAKSIEQEMI